MLTVMENLHLFVMYAMKDLLSKANASFTILCIIKSICFTAWLRVAENPISRLTNLTNMPKNTLVLPGIVVCATTVLMTDGTYGLTEKTIKDWSK